MAPSKTPHLHTGTLEKHPRSTCSVYPSGVHERAMSTASVAIPTPYSAASAAPGKGFSLSLPLHRICSLGLTVATILGLVGCASTSQIVPKVSDEKPPSDKALIVVERSSTPVGFAIKNSVHDNNRFVGSLNVGGKLSWLRDPGRMDLSFFGPWGYAVESVGTATTSSVEKSGADVVGAAQRKLGKSLTVLAGEKYYFKIGNNLLTGFQMDGPGVPIDGNLKYTPRGDSLVFFRFLPNESKGLVRILNLKTEQVFLIDINHTAGKNNSWLALYLPLGEYHVSEHEVSEKNGYSTVVSKTPINAEFTITKPNCGIYVGDITVTSHGIYIGKDPVAAREFLQQNSQDLPYIECLMLINQ